MRYLVSSGIGFLGTELCLRLLGQGRKVVALDDLSTSFPLNPALLKAQTGFSFIKHDIAELIPDIWEFDFIYNLACPARYACRGCGTLQGSGHMALAEKAADANDSTKLHKQLCPNRNAMVDDSSVAIR